MINFLNLSPSILICIMIHLQGSLFLMIKTQTIDQFIKVNYPNFEIILLDTYINLFTQGDNYCPAFWNDCSEESLDSFFSGAEEFSDTWEGRGECFKFS
jgi:hypothetical protein